jgi:hypothetical protein
MADPSISQGGQLPPVQESQAPGVAAPNVPNATLSLSPGAERTGGVIQQALTILMDPSLSPYQMSVRFAHLKEGHIDKTYGITIE